MRLREPQFTARLVTANIIFVAWIVSIAFTSGLMMGATVHLVVSWASVGPVEL